MNHLKVLMVGSEVAPYAKTGGLADVLGALPEELLKQGVDVKVILPKYRIVDDYFRNNNIVPELFYKNVNVYIGWRKEKANFYRIKTEKGLEVFFVERKEYFDREKLYGTGKGDYPDNAERFSFFAMAVLQMIRHLGFKPDIVHCHDWQTGLIPAYIKLILHHNVFYKKIKTLFTIHNLAYQGIFPYEKLNTIAIDDTEFVSDKLEFYNQISFIKAGIVYSDKINTVSEKHAEEIQTLEYGCGFEGLLSSRSHDLVGILNGIDYDVWNPVTDNKIFANYSKEEFFGKTTNKKQLKLLCGFKENELDIPLIGIVSRIVDQKGFDIISEIIEDMMELDLQIILLGTGEKKYHVLFEKIMHKHPDRIKVFLKYDALFAQKIYAGADMFLMPSNFEPCGLTQLIALKYGTIPIVNKTGGLADTICDFDLDKKNGNGFVMKDYSSAALMDAIKLALNTYRNKSLWHKLAMHAMDQDFSWEVSTKKYINLYKKMLK